MTGYICVSRDDIDSEDWLSEPFTRAQAWIDLIYLANYEEMFAPMLADKEASL